MQAAVQYQDTLQAMFDWLDNTVIKLCTMPPVGTDLNTVKDQLNEMKVCDWEWLLKRSCVFVFKDLV